MLDAEHHELLAQVAAMYYEQDLTQNAIAENLGLSRVKVYRLLVEAREAGVVQINIAWPLGRDSQLERALQQRFNLQEALVLKTTTRRTSLRRLGQLTARYLEPQFRHMQTMAVCLGRSTYEVINAIRPDVQAQVQIVQAIGSIPSTLHEWDSSALVRQLAHKLGGEGLYLTSPLMADSPEAAQVILRQQAIERTLNAARQANLALVGIGNLDPDVSGFIQAGFLQPPMIRAWMEQGAVGDLAWRVFQADGQPFSSAFDQRVIGLTLAELAHIPLTLGVAAGSEKAKAIRGALHLGVLNILATDDLTAAAVLEA